MDFNDRGFLGQAIVDWRNAVVARAHKPFFKFAYDVNDFCQRAKYSLNIHNQDGQAIIVASLFLKMLFDYQGAILLLERGMVAQGEALLRCALEAYLLIKRAVDDEEFAVAWAHSDHRDRLRMLQSVGIGEGGLPPIADAAELQAKIAEVEKQIEDTKAKPILVRDILKNPGAEWLPSLYMFWSFSVHSVPRAVQQYVEGGSQGMGVKGFKSGPSEDGLDAALAWGAIVMLEVWTPLSKLFGVTVQSEVDAFEARFRELTGSRMKRTADTGLRRDRGSGRPLPLTCKR